jgi:hypothetical protein
MFVHEQPRRAFHCHDAGTARAHASPTPANRPAATATAAGSPNIHMPFLITGGDRAATIWLAILFHKYIIIHMFF